MPNETLYIVDIIVAGKIVSTVDVTALNPEAADELAKEYISTKVHKS